LATKSEEVQIMLEIINYSKKYENGKLAVDNISLTVEKGDLFAFIGHNGAGKSTTIKSVVGILPYEKGEIKINGISVKDNPVECKKMIAYIPDNPDLYESLTGIDYLNFISDVFEVSIDKRKNIIEKYATLFGIKDSLNNYIGSYPHGMKQKLAIISALVHEPKLLILDEPFVGLDPIASHAVKEVMKEFCSNGGAIFFSTHVLEVAEKLCNKIAIIKEGKLVVTGNMDEVTKNSSLEDVFLELSNHA
jgi:ABC-2 type transport system ATP-binding protein